MLLTTRLVYLDLSEMTEIQAKWAEIKEKILSEAFPLEPQAATGWTTVWPTEPGRYWAYGQLFGKPVHPDTKPRLEMCDVKQIGPQDNPSFVYVACGNFMYKSEAAEVWFMKANEPQLPTVKDAENGNNNC